MSTQIAYSATLLEGIPCDLDHSIFAKASAGLHEWLGVFSHPHHKQGLVAS